ncbi:MAG: hypothetical protein DME26_10730, partial [Verrucomicrobia bacterium]
MIEELIVLIDSPFGGIRIHHRRALGVCQLCMSGKAQTQPQQGTEVAPARSRAIPKYRCCFRDRNIVAGYGLGLHERKHACMCIHITLSFHFQRAIVFPAASGRPLSGLRQSQTPEDALAKWGTTARVISGRRASGV